MGKLLTFNGGVVMPEFKELSEKSPIEEQKIPQTVFIPLNQHVGAECEPLVKVGDHVRAGDMIGESKASLSAPVHSSISGIVKSIEPVYILGGSYVNSVVIESDGGDERAELLDGHGDYREVSNDMIAELVYKAGIVGMGGGAFPTHSKLKSSNDGTIDSVIVNAAECEPFLTCDHRMMLEWSEKLICGLKIVMKYLNVEHGYIGIEDNKMDAISLLSEKLSKDKNIKVSVLKTKFPQGDSYRMVDSILNRKVPKGGRTKNVNTFVSNVGTYCAIYDAVVNGLASYERVVTVTGNGIKNPKNIKAKIGTPIKELIAQAGGFNGNVSKIIAGGPMTGVSQFDLNAPVCKNTSAIILLRDEDYKEDEETQCIKCAKCVEACPVYLLPLYIARYQQLGMIKKADDLNASSCIECGSCSYVCPAKRFLSERIKAAKKEIKMSKKRSDRR